MRELNLSEFSPCYLGVRKVITYLFFHITITVVLPLFTKEGYYSAILNHMKLVRWPLMGGLLHLVQRGGDWAGLVRCCAVLVCP